MPARANPRGSAWGPVILPVFKTGGRQESCRRCVRLAHASAIFQWVTSVVCCSCVLFVSESDPGTASRATFPAATAMASVTIRP